MNDCFLCGNIRADIILGGNGSLTYLVKCPNCGEYRISEQVISNITNGTYQEEAFPSVAGIVFDHFYYRNEVKMVLTEDFMTVKPIKTLEKLYRLAKFLYTEAERRGDNDLPHRPACCYSDQVTSFKLLSTLKNIGIVDFFEAVQRGGAQSTPTAIIEAITLTTRARIAFDNGIETAERFEEVFMNMKKGGDTFNTNIYGDQSHAQIGGSHNTMIKVEGGVSDQQIAFIEPEIVELSTECGKGMDKCTPILLKIKEKLGTFAGDIVTQILSALITSKLTS